VKHLDSVVVEVYVLKVIELLQYEMAWIEEEVAALVPVDEIKKHLEGCTIVQIFPGVNLVAEVDPILIEHVEDGSPAICQFLKGGLYQTSGTLRPWI
jgi:hypothetical protein